jgi:hypothetical protein
MMMLRMMSKRKQSQERQRKGNTSNNGKERGNKELATRRANLKLSHRCLVFALKLRLANNADLVSFLEVCNRGGSLFYLRAYGPAILPGLVTEMGRTTLHFYLWMREAITIEVVLAFSHPPHYSFPLETITDLVYEGYMLPGFPLLISAGYGSSDTRTTCGIRHGPSRWSRRRSTRRKRDRES